MDAWEIVECFGAFDGRIAQSRGWRGRGEGGYDTCARRG